MTSLPEDTEVKAHVLVIDEDAAVRLVLAHFISVEGFDVTTASTLEEAERVDRHIPSAVIVDWDFSAPDTSEKVCDWLRNSISVPILFFPGKMTRELSQLAEEFEAPIVMKPHFEDLIRNLKTALGLAA